MREIEKTILFKSQNKPISSLWSVGDICYLGVLIWNKDRPVLTIYFEVNEDDAIDFDEADIPILKITKPPLRANFVGQVSQFGFVTLDECIRYNVRANNRSISGKCTYELDFFPRTIWIGHWKNAVEGRVTRVVASDRRLAGFFGSPGLRALRHSDPRYSGVYEALDNPDAIWALNSPNQHKIPLGETGWIISVRAEIISGSSSTHGHTCQSNTCITAFAPQATSIDEAGKIIMQLEDLFSVLSIEPFRFETETFDTDDIENISVVWRLGVDEELFRAPMRHQILVDLSNIETLRTACQRWFSATETEKLSRWLFARALRETESGLARFVSVSQAFEVLGREFGPSNPMPKSQVREAVARIRDVLSKDFDKYFVDRSVNLIQSSNRSSFRDTLHHMLSTVVRDMRLGGEDDLKKFCKKISDTRNSVTHMTDNEENQLNEAFSRVNKLSLQLCFWYSVFQAHRMGLAIPDIRTFLFNNRNARHGLPNELLEIY